MASPKAHTLLSARFQAVQFRRSVPVSVKAAQGVKTRTLPSSQSKALLSPLLPFLPQNEESANEFARNFLPGGVDFARVAVYLPLLTGAPPLIDYLRKLLAHFPDPRFVHYIQFCFLALAFQAHAHTPQQLLRPHLALYPEPVYHGSKPMATAACFCFFAGTSLP